MLVLVVLLMGHHDIVIRDQGFHTYVENFALVVIIVGGFEGYSQTVDLVTESLQLLYSFVYRLLYSLGMVYTAKYNLSITDHVCASCTPILLHVLYHTRS